ncbi:hypothetical protein DPX16_17979 [Anabarilius grahami]|uniref:Uncharacterized protein n=1 Tax=Anabarilius grahami TaxID=495550 RepID=A0A3N0XT07_ANAGA|nr:hypothetical protein DPX16_17979 [Anabarilius grahami]
MWRGGRGLAEPAAGESVRRRVGQHCMKSTETSCSPLTRVTSTRGYRPEPPQPATAGISTPHHTVTKDTGQISLSSSVDGVSVLVFLCSSL